MGLGTHLLEQLVAYARSRGIAGIYSEVLPTNAAMLAIHERMGHSVRWDSDANLFKIRHRFAESPPERS